VSLFAKAPHDILYNSDLSLAERVLLVRLIEVQGKNDTSWHKQSVLAKTIGVSLRTVNAAINKLQQLGYISIEYKGGDLHYSVLSIKKDKTDTQNVRTTQNLHNETEDTTQNLRTDYANFAQYTTQNLHNTYIEELDQLELDQRTRPNTFGDFEKVDEEIEVVHAEIIQPLEVEPPPKKAKPPKQVQTFEAEFEEFWENYPRSGGINKGSKQKAKQIFTKILTHTKTQPSEIMQGLQAYAAYLQHTGTIFKQEQLSAHATTWLNQGRWEDDYTIVASNRNKQSTPERPRAYGDTVFDVFDQVRAAHGI
jgi:hypothetical protein